MAEEKKIVTLLQKYAKSGSKLPVLAPFEFMVHGLFTEYETPAVAADALTRLKTTFVDYNDVRVARWTEVATAMLPFRDADPCARRLRDLLNRLFDRCGTMSLQFMTMLKLNDARRELAKLEPEIAKKDQEKLTLVLYMLVPNFPVVISNEALNVAKNIGIIGKSGTRQNLQKALADSGLSGEERGALIQYLEHEAHKKDKVKEKKETPPKNIGGEQTTKKKGRT